MAATYEPIYSATLGSAASSITINSFSGYTDLVVVLAGRRNSGGTSDNYYCRINSDSGSNYSWTGLAGNGSSAYSERTSNDAYCRLGTIAAAGAGSSVYGTSVMNFQNYTNSTTYKTILTRASSGGEVMAGVSLWRSTSAITSITFYTAGLADWASGSSISVYGIKAA